MSHGIHEEKHVRYALMYSGLSCQVCEGAGVYEGNEDVQGYVVVPVTERSRGDLHAATGTCSPSLLLVFCALGFASRRPSRFHGDTVSPVTQALDLGDIINSPFLPRPRSGPRHLLENYISDPTREECKEEASMGLGDIREKEIEEKVEADSPERRRGLPGRE